MSGIASWNDTAAAVLRNGGWVAEDRHAAREAEWRQARTEFEAKLNADPAWAAARQVQQELAERGWTGSWLHVSPSRPPELEPLFSAARAAETRMATWGPDGNGGMRPTNDLAERVEEHGRQRYEAARLRKQVENRLLPPGVEAL